MPSLGWHGMKEQLIIDMMICVFMCAAKNQLKLFGLKLNCWKWYNGCKSCITFQQRWSSKALLLLYYYLHLEMGKLVYGKNCLCWLLLVAKTWLQGCTISQRALWTVALDLDFCFLMFYNCIQWPKGSHSLNLFRKELNIA